MPPTTLRGRRSFPLTSILRLLAAGALALAVATCSDEHLGGPSGGTRGYFGFRPVTHLSAPPASFGIVIDSVHIRLTRPPSTIVLDTTAAFPADSSDLHLSLLVPLQQEAETLLALVELKAGPTLVFSGTQNVVVVNGPPGSSPPPAVNLSYVGPGKGITHISVAPKDTAIALGDSTRYSATADSAGTPVAQFYVGWKTSDTTLAKMNATGLLRAPNHRGTLKVIGTTPTGIADTTTVFFVPVATALVKTSGDLQSGTVAQSPALPITVQAKAADNLGVAGVAVHFSAISGGAVTDSIVITDSLGHAATPITLGTAAGAQRFVARVGALVPDTFTVTAVAGAPSAIAIQGGNAQTDTTDLALPQPLATQVTDAFGNAVTGAKVVWAKVAGGGTLAADTTASDTAGIAKVGYTLGALARTDTLSATLAGTTAKVTFTATAIAAAAANVAIVSGNAQTDTVTKTLPLPLVVLVTDARAHLVAGARVIWSAQHGGGAFSPDTVFTDTTGHAQTTYTVGTLAGNDTLVASGSCGCTATFTAVALAGAPSAISIQSGNAQTDTINTGLPTPLVVKVTDAFGNPATGATINWTRIGGGTLSTASNITAVTGLAQVTYTLGATPRVDSIRATLGAGPAAVTFTATTVPPAPTGIAILSGNGQSDTVTRTLAQPLVVTVTGAGAKPVAGTRVAFSVKNGTGTFSGPAVDTVTTDTLGHASAPFTLGALAGTDSIQAKTVTGGLTVTFALTGIPAAPSVIGVQAGNGQADTIGLALPAPLVAKVTDSHGNAVPGAKVFWTRVAGDGVIGSDSSFTNAAGVAQTGYTLGNVPRVDSVHATIAGTGSFALFTATTVPPAPSAIAIVSGNAQSDTVGKALSLPMVVSVTGAGAKPVAGTKVAFSVKSGSGSFPTGAVDTITTDTLGHAQVPFTLGTTAGLDSVQARTVTGGFTAVFGATAVAAAPASIIVQSGNTQSDTISTALPLPLAAKVLDAHANPVPGAKVFWARVAGGGAVGSDSSFTNTAGVAQTTYILGATPRVDSVSATVAGTAFSVLFTATTVPPAPSAITIVSGSAQSDTVGKTLALPLVVSVTGAGPKPVAGTKVAFSVKSGTGSFPTGAADTVTTDTLGHASVPFTLGTVAGVDSVQAKSITGGLTTTFGATALAAAASNLAIQSGNGQADTISTALPAPFVVKVSDAFGNPITGATVNWTRLAGGGTLSAGSSTTLATGLTQVTYTLGATPRVDSLKATLGAGPASVLFTATTVPPAPSAIGIVGGTAQTDSVGRTLAQPLVVSVSGAGGKPVSGAKVVFSVKSGTGSFPTGAVDTVTTDTLGHAQVAFTLGTVAGADSVLARTVVGGFTVTFGETAIPLAPSALTPVSGNAQTDTISTALPAPFVVKVGDAFGNPITGAKVVWTTAPGNGNFGGLTTDTVTTLANGQASITLTTGATVKADTATAALLGTALTTRFTTTVVPPAPVGIAVLGGGGQSDTVGKTLPQPFLIQVTGAGAKPVAGAQVTFSFKTGTGTVAGKTADTVATDTLGKAQVTITLGTVAQVDSIQAKTVAGGLTTTIGATAVAGIPSAIALVSGNAQSDTAKGTLPLPLVVKVTDAQSNPVNAAKVIWTVQSGTGTFGGLAVDTVTTGVTGQGSVNFTLGTAAGLDTLKATIAGTSTFVLFTATGTSGAASALTIVSGNTQTDTVGVPLPAPFVVRVADGSNNPVANTKVFWTRTFGAGTVSADSTVTDALGHTQITFTLAAIVGTDSIKGALAGGTNVLFGAAGTPGAAAVIAMTGGNNQSGTTGTALATPLTVKVTDAHANPVPGRTVTWAVTAGGGTLGGVTAITDATGTSTVAQWTLGGIAGTNTATATLAGVSGSPVTFTAVSLPLGTTKTWTGTAGTAWNTAGSWSPAGVPVSTDNVYIPASAPAPSVTANASVGGVSIETGGTLTLGANDTLTTLGTILVPGGATVAGSGALALNGTSQQVSGTVANLVVTNTALLAGATHVTGNATISGSGTLAVNGKALAVGGNVSVTGAGQLLMTNAADSVDVTGSYTADGGSNGTNLSAGVLVLRGNLTQLSNSSGDFAPSGTHVTRFAGATAQSVSFANPALANSRFQNVEFANAAGVTFTTDLAANGGVTITAGTVIGTNHAAILGAGLTDATSSRWHVDTTTFSAGGALALPDSMTGVVAFNGSGTTLGKAFKVNGTTLLIGSATLAPAGHPLTITGSLAVSQSAVLVMTNAADSVDVGSLFTTNSNTSAAGDLSAGKLVLRGSFTQTTGSTFNFATSGTHRTIFAGNAAQAVLFGSPGATSAHFQDVTFADPAGVTFGSNAVVNGTATVTAGQVTGPIRALTIGTALVDGGFGWHPDTTLFQGAGTLFPDSLTGSVHFQGADTLAHSFKALGQLTVDGSGTLTVNGHVLTADSTLTIAGSGLLRMTSALDSVDVGTAFNVNTITASNADLSAGTLVLRGSFTQNSGSGLDFSATGTHRTIFAGTAAQSATFQNPALTSSHFQDVVFNNAAGVTFASPLAVSGSTTILAGNVTGATGHIATLAGNLVDASNSRWHVDTTYFTGSPALPDSFSGSVHFQGSTTLTKALKIIGATAVDGSGVFTLNGHPFTVTGAFTLGGGAQLVMTNATDSMDVGGAFSVNSTTSSGTNLSAGTLVLRGSFTQNSGSGLDFSATGTHRTILAGTAAQAVTFANPAPTSSHFQDLLVDNPAGISLGSAAVAAGNVTLRRGAVTGTGHGFTVGLNLSDTSNVSWHPDTTIFAGAPTTLPDSIQGVVHFQGAANLAKALKVKGAAIVEGSGQLQPSGHPLIVTGALSLTGSSRFIMSNAADSVDVGGLFSATSGTTSTGDLTQGVLFLRGGFSQGGSSSSFAPSGSHRVRFGGATAQSVSFANPGQSGFNLVEFADAAGVTATSDLTVSTTATMVSGTLTGTGHGATIAGTLQDAGGNGWRMDTTTYTGTPGTLPDSIHGVVHFQAPVTLAKAFRVAGPLFLDGANGVLTPNGFPLTVSGVLHLAGSGQLKMLANADSVDVGGMTVATSVSGTGLDTAGVLVLRGGFHQTSGSTTGFAASGSHLTRLVTGSVDSVSFFNPSFTSGSHFSNVQVTPGAGTIILGSDVEAVGTITKAPGTVPTLRGVSSLLGANGLNIDGLVLDSLRLVKSGILQVVRFDSVTFQHVDPTETQFTLSEGGAAAQQLFTGVRFTTVPTGAGRYLQVADSSANSLPVTIGMDHSFPLNGMALTSIVGGNDGASVNWSILVYLPGPQNDTTGVVLAPPIHAVAVGPVGDTLTSFSDTVTIAIGTNPVGGTLSGTLKRAAVAGVATFNDLVIAGVGNGYTLAATTPQLPTVTSAPFNIGIFVPPGISAIWSGATDSLWTKATNWQSGVVPDSTSNVFIPAGMPHSPYLATSGFAHVNRLVIAPSAAFKADTFSTVQVDSSLDNSSIVTGGGTIQLAKAGTVRGIFNTLTVTGNYAAVPGSGFQANRDLTVTGVTARLDLNGTNSATNGSLTVTSGGLLVMTHAGDTLSVVGDATFSGGNELGFLTAGRILLQGNLAQYGSSQAGPSPTAFAATAGHVTELMRGSGIQTVHFANPDTAASHLGSVVFSGADSVVFDTLAVVLGNATVSGASTAVSSKDTLAVAGNVTTVAGSRLWLTGLGVRGTLAASGAYHVGTTGFVGAGQTIPALAYDSIQVVGSAVLGTNVSAARMIVGGKVAASQFDLNGHKLTLTGDAFVDTSGTLVMHSATDTLAVGGNLTVQGHDSLGWLTAGLIDLAGNISVPSTASNVFVASGTHTVRFNGGAHTWSLPAPLALPVGYVAPKFQNLVVTGGATVNGLSSAAIGGDLTVTGSTLVDTTRHSVGDFTFPNVVGATGNVTVDATSTLQILNLAVGGVLSAPTAAPQYNVTTTTFTGTSQVVPVLPYQGVLVNGTAHGTAALTMSSLTIGNGVGGSLFDPAGFPLTITGQLQVANGGTLNMTAATDSVDVGSTTSFAGDNSSGHLTAGVLVLRSGFVQNAGGNDSAFFATGTHRTVFTNGGSPIIGIGYAGTRFNRLVIRDTLSLQSGTLPLLVGDSLVLQGGTLADAGFGRLTALGPVVGDSLSELRVDTLETYGALVIPVDTNFGVKVTRFFGTNQAIPSNLSYLNVDILGTVHPVAHFEAQDTLNILAGEFDVNGQTVIADSAFNTAGAGTLKMVNALDTMTVFGPANFNGGSTAGLLTAGIFTTSSLVQGSTNSSQSFAASGSHVLHIIDAPLFGAAQISFATPGSAASHPQNLSFNTASQLHLVTNLYVADTLTVPSSDGSVLGNAGVAVTVQGPLMQTGFMNFTVDTLILLDPNPIQGSSTPSFWTPVVTRFAGTNQAIRDTVTYHTVEVTGSAHVNFHASTDSIIVNGGNLTIGAGNIGTNGDFRTENGGILTMTTPTSNLFVNGNATFGGGSTASSLTAGQIQVGGNFTELGTGSTTDFAPLGTSVLLNGGVQQTAQFGAPQSSYFRDLTVNNTGGMFAKGGVLVTNNFSSNQRIDGDTLSVFGTFTDTNTIAPPVINLKALLLAGPLVTSPGVTYAVQRTHFLATNAIPALAYQDVVVNAPITTIVSGATMQDLYIAGPGAPLHQGSAPSASLTLSPGALFQVNAADVEQGSLDLGGGRLIVDSLLNVGAGATVTMTHPSDTLQVGGNAVFGGNSTAGLLTNGTLILGRDLTQTGDPHAFAPSGSHLTSFQGISFSAGVNHNISFASPFTSAFANLREDYPDTLTLQNNTDVVGRLTITHAPLEPGLLVRSTAGQTLGFGGADIHAAVFDTVPVVYTKTDSFVTFDSVTFRAPVNAFTQFTAQAPNGDTVILTNTVFTLIGDGSGGGTGTGTYIAAHNTSGAGTLTVVGEFPNIGSAEFNAHIAPDAFSSIVWSSP